MRPARPAPLFALLLITFLGSVSSGIFWAGIFFVTAAHYHFSPVRNLVLAGAMGAIYALGARLAGGLLRALDRRLSPRALLAATLAIWGLVALVPLCWPGSEPALWIAALLGAAGSALTWPLVESYLAAGRHGAQMRRAIGWFNLTWTPATAVPLLVLPLFAGGHELDSLGLSALVNGAAVLGLLALPARPGTHERAAALAAVGAEYPWLLRSLSWLLPLSYVMSSTLAPVLPHRLVAVGALTANASLVAALWMLTRFLTLGAMALFGFWHGRWETLTAGAVALLAGLCTVLIAHGLTGLIAGLLLFGVGMGLIYYAALYYTLAVGHAEVDAGGGFEALIGAGYCVGPLLGIAGHTLTHERHASTATVGLVFAVAGVSGLLALRPYLAARRARRAPESIAVGRG